MTDGLHRAALKRLHEMVLARGRGIDNPSPAFTYMDVHYQLDPCPGEAHANAFIDNCSLCAPLWGWLVVRK